MRGGVDGIVAAGGTDDTARDIDGALALDGLMVLGTDSDRTTANRYCAISLDALATCGAVTDGDRTTLEIDIG